MIPSVAVDSVIGSGDISSPPLNPQISNNNSNGSSIDVNIIKSTEDLKLIQYPTLKNILHEFTKHVHSTETIFNIANDLSRELLNAYNRNSNRTMLHTKNVLPSGQEKGRFLVIDLGGSTLRIAIIDLISKGNVEIIQSKQWKVANDLKTIDLKFFDWIGKNVLEVLQSGNYFDYHNNVIKVGMSWSFPIEQNSIDEAYINVVSKGYVLTEETKGKNLADLLSNALLNYNIKIQMEAIVNDAVSVFLTGLFMHETNLGIVVGTGINASLSLDEIVLNAELGYFGSCFCKYASKMDLQVHEKYLEIEDIHMDNDLEVFQPLEFMCSGRYISELLRLSIIELINAKEIFVNNNSEKTLELIKIPYCLSGEVLCNIFETKDSKKLKEIFTTSFDQPNCSYEDYEKIIAIIKVIIYRGSVLLSAALLAICEITEENKNLLHKKTIDGVIKVGYVGSLLQYFHSYRNIVQELLNVASSQIGLPKIELILIDDSSVLGAAIAAASHDLQSSSKL